MNNLIPVNYQNQRVLTTVELSDAYGAEPVKIQQNFSNNKERYTEGKHFFLLQGDDLQEFLRLEIFEVQNQNKIRSLYLWTEKGAWLHAKSLNTDEAWEAYEMLVDDYYAVKQTGAPMQSLSPQLQLLISMELKQNEMQKEITENKEAVQSIRDVVSLNTTSWRIDSSFLIGKIAHGMGGSEHIRELRKESYKLLDTRMGVSLGIRLTNKRRRMAEEGICKSKRENFNPLDVIAEDKKLVEGYVAIMKDMAIRYGV